MTDTPERIWAGVLTDEYRGMTGTRIRVWGDDPRVGTDDPATEYIRAELIEAMEAENQQMKELICWAYDTLKEINPSNYHHDDVCALNDASVEVILGLASIANGASHDD